MNHSETQIIPLLRGFRAKPFPTIGDRICFPNYDTLIELLRPDANPEQCEVCQFELEQSDQIPDLDSQILLQKYSNELLARIGEYDYINLMCKDLDLDSQEAHYHGFVAEYIETLFPEIMPVANKLSCAATEMLNTCNYYLSDNEVLHIGRNFEALLLEASNTRSVAHKLYLKDRFVDYQKSSEYLHNLYIMAIENKSESFMAALKYYNDETEKLCKHMKKTRRVPSAEREPLKLIRQCPYCHKWYEQNLGGNGRLVSHCLDSSCFKTWDRNRRKKNGILK